MKKYIISSIFIITACKNGSFSSATKQPAPATTTAGSTSGDGAGATAGATAGSGITAGGTTTTAGSTATTGGGSTVTASTGGATSGLPTAGTTSGVTATTGTTGSPTTGTTGAPPTPVNVGITFTLLGGNACWQDCIQMRLNGGNPLQIGCNSASASIVQAAVLPRPSINRIGLDFTHQNLNCRGSHDSSPVMNISTLIAGTVISDPSMQQLINHLGMNVFLQGNILKGQVNDNGDGDPNDMLFQISGLDQAAFQIENTSISGP